MPGDQFEFDSSDEALDAAGGFEVIHALSDLTCATCGEPIRQSDRVHAADGEPLVHEACHVQEKIRSARLHPMWDPADQERWRAGS